MLESIGYKTVRVTKPRSQMGSFIMRLYFKGRLDPYTTKEFGIRFTREDLYARNFRKTYANKKRDLYELANREKKYLNNEALYHT